MGKGDSGASNDRGAVNWGKKWFMRQYWRLQQSQAIASLLLWTSTITLLVWPYVSWRFKSGCDSDLCFSATFLGLPSTYWGLIIIATCVVSIVLLIGFIYDQTLTLWKEHQNVILERNPFATYLLTPRDAIIIGHLITILRTQHPEDEKIQSQCDWMEKWIATIPELEVFRRMVTELDAKLDEPVPDFTFLPEGAVEAARAKARKDEMVSMDES
jgi:hypothetical protein